MINEQVRIFHMEDHGENDAICIVFFTDFSRAGLFSKEMQQFLSSKYTFEIKDYDGSYSERIAKINRLLGLDDYVMKILKVDRRLLFTMISHFSYPYSYGFF